METKNTLTEERQQRARNHCEHNGGMKK